MTSDKVESLRELKDKAGNFDWYSGAGYQGGGLLPKGDL
jgi:hypothetical protein